MCYWKQLRRPRTRISNLLKLGTPRQHAFSTGLSRKGYRAVYTVKLAGGVYVLHAFQKKSKQGIATPRQDIDLIEARLKRTKEH